MFIIVNSLVGDVFQKGSFEEISRIYSVAAIMSDCFDTLEWKSNKSGVGVYPLSPAPLIPLGRSYSISYLLVMRCSKKMLFQIDWLQYNTTIYNIFI